MDAPVGEYVSEFVLLVLTFHSGLDDFSSLWEGGSDIVGWIPVQQKIASDSRKSNRKKRRIDIYRCIK